MKIKKVKRKERRKNYRFTLNKDPHYKRDSSSHFFTRSPRERHIRDGGHREQAGSKCCGIGISRHKAKCVLKKVAEGCVSLGES